MADRLHEFVAPARGRRSTGNAPVPGAVLIGFACLLVCLVVPCLAYGSVTVWRNMGRGIKEPDLRTVAAVSHDGSGLIFAASSSALYRTGDGGRSWDEVLSFRGTGNAINSIAINPLDTNTVYAGTGNGLYMSRDGGESWRRVLEGIGDREGRILHVAVNPARPDVVYVGTGSGLFRTDNGGGDWTKGRGLPNGVPVTSVAVHLSEPDTVYAGTGRGVYRSLNSGRDWKRVFGVGGPADGNGYEPYDDADTDEYTGAGAEVRSLAVDPVDRSTVYAYTTRGLFFTEDGGLTWRALGTLGMAGGKIHHLLTGPADPDGVYAATGKGVFRYSKASGRWTELYKGLASTEVRFLAFGPPAARTLWAVTDRGVFKTVSVSPDDLLKDGAKDVLSLFADEPSIMEIQEAAIRYAEVHPDKIRSWRSAAAKRAWLPTLKIAYDEGRDWESSGYFYGGTYRDDDITKGRDRGWSVSLTWELGDLIWNDDQTSIDTRSRLMVQLRDDVLNEVTRLYFERRRLQVEMHLSSPKETKERMETVLRIQELTADIDALTGFYLSRRLGRGRMAGVSGADTR